MLSIGGRGGGQNNPEIYHLCFYFSLQQSIFNLSVIRLFMTTSCKENNTTLVWSEGSMLIKT